METLGPGASGLGWAMAAKQHPPTRLAPQGTQRPGEQLSLVVTALTHMLAGGGCPRDDVDLGGIQPATELLGQMAGKATTISVLQPNHEISAQTYELGGGHDSGGGDNWRRRHESESATPAQLHTWFGTPCTATVQHDSVVTRGCATVTESRVAKPPGTALDAPVASQVVVLSELPVTSRYQPRSATADWVNRLIRCIGGLAMFGVGIALILQAELGAAPWDMLHKGISEHTGISVGVVIAIIGFLLLLIWIPLHQRVGVGTILNAIEIGLVVDLVSPHLPETDRLLPRITFLVVGVLIIAVGSGFYIGAGLGTGPRDGIMVGLSQRGISVRLARTVVEFVVGVGGIALGVRPGIGTLIFMFGIGPLVQQFLPRMSLPARKTTIASVVIPEGA